MLTSTTMTNRVAKAVALCAVATVWFASPASARESVDPTQLNPPPPDFFNADCARTGGHITCTLHFEDPPIVDEPSGVVCDGTEILFSQNRSVVGKRIYSEAGDLLQRHFREDLDGTLSNPETGESVAWIAQDTVLHDLAVPGDVATGTTRIVGTPMRVFVDGGGSILIDAGVRVLDAATETLISSHGPAHFDDYFNGDEHALDAVCDSLA
jgi:hypothetical protein